MSAPADCIAANLERVRRRITAAAEAAGRSADDVTLLAVTKYVGLPEVQALVAAGCHELGESRPQALWEKAAEPLGPVHWHLIGHLQRNKVRRTVPDVAMIHSVDSERRSGRSRRLRVDGEGRGSLGPSLRILAPGELGRE